MRKNDFSRLPPIVMLPEEQSPSLRFFHEWEAVAIHGTKLPHWQQPGVTTFVTFRLADSIPATLLTQWETEREAWLQLHPPPHDPAQLATYHQQFSARLEHWLDQGHGSCLLREHEAAGALAAVLRNTDDRVTLHAWVIMPNHVHLLFSPDPAHPHSTPDLLKSWKGTSARQINQALGRNGTLWMKHYFDRLVRNESHFHACVNYIRRNPKAANLREGEYLLYESEFITRTVPEERL